MKVSKQGETTPAPGQGQTPQNYADRQKAVYWSRKAAGLCVKCGASAVPDRAMCGRCAEEQAEHVARSKAKWMRQGRCRQCGAVKLNRDRQCCVDCRRKDLARRKAKPQPQEQAAA